MGPIHGFTFRLRTVCDFSFCVLSAAAVLLFFRFCLYTAARLRAGGGWGGGVEAGALFPHAQWAFVLRVARDRVKPALRQEVYVARGGGGFDERGSPKTDD